LRAVRFRPEVLRFFAGARLAVLFRFAGARFAVVFRFAGARFAVLFRFAGARFAVLLRFAVVFRFAGARFAVLFRFAVVFRLAGARFAVLLRFAVVFRFAGARFAGARFAVLRLAVLRFAADFLELRGGMPHLLEGLNYPAASAVPTIMGYPSDGIVRRKGYFGPRMIESRTFMLHFVDVSTIVRGPHFAFVVVFLAAFRECVHELRAAICKARDVIETAERPSVFHT